MINKKFLVTGLIIVVLLFVSGFFWFKFRNNKVNKVDNVLNSDKLNQPSPEVVQQQRQKLETNLEDLQKVLDEKKKTDSDLDGLSDAEEKTLGTDSKKIDTDGDGITDYDEVKIYHTNPLKADTDGDGYSDGAELRRGYDPLGPGKLKK